MCPATRSLRPTLAFVASHPRTILHLHLGIQDGSKRIGEQSPDHVGAAAPPERLHEHDHTTTDGHATALPDADGASIDATALRFAPREMVPTAFPSAV